MTNNSKKEIYNRIMEAASQTVIQMLCESDNEEVDETVKHWDMNRNIVKDIPDMKERLKRVQFDKYIEPTYHNVLKFLKDKYDVVFNWEHFEDADYGYPCWMYQVFPRAEYEKYPKLKDSWKFTKNYQWSEIIYIDDEEWEAIVSIINTIIDDYGKEPEKVNKFGEFDLERDLSEDWPEYKQRLLDVDFPDYEEMTYINVLEFFKNVYGFSYSWNYQYTPSAPGEEAYTWCWSARIPSEDKSKGCSGCWPDFGYEHECEDEEQEAIMSIIDYILNRIENLDF